MNEMMHQVFFGYVLQVFCTKPQKVAYIFSMALNSYETKFDATTSFSSPINILMVQKIKSSLTIWREG